MEINPDDLIGKHYEQLKSQLKRTDFDEEFIKMFKDQTQIVSEAEFLEDNLFFMGSSVLKHKLEFLDNKVVQVQLLIGKSEIEKLILNLKDKFSNTFRYYLKKDFDAVEWRSVEDDENSNVQFKTKRIDFDEEVPFEIKNIMGYELVSVQTEICNIAVYPHKYHEKENQFVFIEIWKI